MDHPSKNHLCEFLQESLDESGTQTVSSHLDKCPECQSTVEEILNSTYVSVFSETLLDTTGRATKWETDSHTREVEKVTDCKHSKLPQFKLGSRFLIRDELGRGGMGAVYRGFDRELKREVAIKVSFSNHHSSGAARFHREAEISGQLQHPGIIPVYELGQLADDRSYIAMKLVEGQTLLSLIHSRAGNVAKHLDIFGDICQTMAYAHSRDVIHRDLKPENIMVGKFGEVQVMDWGLSRNLTNDSHAEKKLDHSAGEFILPGETLAGDVLGTPAYLAPEQACGDRADKRTDVFAMGGILYEILTGKPPFDAPTVTAALQQSLANDLEKAFERLDQTTTDETLVELVKSCLNADINQRPADAQEVSKLFAQYIEGRQQQFENARLEKARTAERLIAQLKRNRQFMWTSAVVVATLLASTIAGYLYLAEKSARVANQANAERELLERKVQSENQIRDSLVNALRHQAQAQQNAPHEQSADWTLALKEIEKAAPFANELIDSELRTEFQQLESTVRAESAAAIRRQNQYELEVECRKELFELAEQSYFPSDLRLCDWVDLTQKFAAAFGRIGIEPGLISRESVSRIANSELKTELVHGLMMWERELQIENAFSVKSQSTENQVETKQWLSRLIEQVDPDPLRTQIRQLKLQSQGQTIVNLAAQDRSVSSLLTIHTFAIALDTAQVAPEDRVGYLLRAHQRFPENFFVNWYLPNLDGGLASQKEFTMACYSIRPKNPAVLLSLGRAFISENQPHRAIEALEELVRVAPHYQMGHRVLVSAYELAGETAKADKQWEIAKQVFAKVRPSFESRLKHYRATNQTDKAATLKTLLTQSAQRPSIAPPSEDTGPKPLSAEVIAKKQELEEKISARFQAILDDPTEYRYSLLNRNYRLLGTLLKESNRSELVDKLLEQAVVQYTKGAELAPGVAAPYVVLTDFCEEFGRLDLAVTAMEKAIEFDRTVPENYERLPQLYRGLIRQHRSNLQPELSKRIIDEAVKSMDTLALAAPPNILTAHENMARFCERYRRYDGAIRAWKRAVNVQPTNIQLQHLLAEVYIDCGKYRLLEGRTEEAYEVLDLAIDYYREWASKPTKRSTPHERLSQACEPRGLLAEAMKHLKIGIEIHPTFKPHQNRYINMAVTRAKQHQANGDASTGIKILKDAIEFLVQMGVKPVNKQPGFMQAYETLSTLYADNGDYAEAIKAIEFVTKRAPKNDLIHERLATYYVASGESSIAESIFRSLHKRSPDSKHAIANLVRFLIDHDKISEAASLIAEANANGISSATLTKLRIELDQANDSNLPAVYVTQPDEPEAKSGK